MKPLFNKKKLIHCISFFVCICSSLVLFILIRSFLPNAVSYSVSTENSRVSQPANAVSQNEEISCLYDSVYDIETIGPFTVKSDGEDIYVLSADKKLYHVDARLSDFPAGDRQAIQKGIPAGTKPELFEIISYMES